MKDKTTDSQSRAALRQSEERFHHNIAVVRAAHKGSIEPLVGHSFEVPSDPVDVLLQVRQSLAHRFAEAVADGGFQVPLTWLRDVAELLQIDLPGSEYLTDDWRPW